MLYVYEQVGDSDPYWLRRLVANRSHGVASLGVALPVRRTVPQMFRDFALALYLDDPLLADGRFGFRALDLHGPGDVDDFPRPQAHAHSGYLAADQVQLGSWTVRADRVSGGRGSLQLELTASGPVCVGVGAVPAGTATAGSGSVETRCLEAAEPFALGFDSFGPGGRAGLIYAVAANASDRSVSLSMTSARLVGVAGRSLVFLPFAANRSR
jgi:hypothetical protein